MKCFYNRLQGENMSKRDVNKEKNVIIGIAIGIILLLLCVIIWLYLFCSNGIWQEYITISPSEYGKWDGHIDYEREGIESGLYIFPGDISNAVNVDYFYYTALDSHSISKILIFAEITYSGVDYQVEKERIASLQCKIGVSEKEQTVSNSIVYSQDLFSYPAYVAIYGSNLSYEYALLDEENSKIIYVYAKLKDLNGIIPEEYLPIEFIGRDMYANNSWDNINIYYAENNAGDYVFYDNDRVVATWD